MRRCMLRTSCVASARWPVTRPSPRIWAYAVANVFAGCCTTTRMCAVASALASPFGSYEIDDQVRVVADDRLGVRREAGELRARSLLRIVGLVVDGDHLFAGADREQRLCCRRRQRDDPVWERCRRAGAGDEEGSRKGCEENDEPGHESSLPRGVRWVSRRAAGLLTRGSPFAAFPAEASGTAGEGHLPLQRRDRPGLAPGSLTARLSRGTLSSSHGPEGSRRPPTRRAARAARPPHRRGAPAEPSSRLGRPPRPDRLRAATG